MQSQDSAADFLFKLWPQIEANKNRIIAGAAGIVAVVIIFSFISWRHEQNAVEAGEAITQSLINLPPGTAPDRIADAELDIAAEYPGTPAGQRALLAGAAGLFAEGKYTDAQAYFQKFLDAHPDNEYSAQAALGVAKCLDAEGKSNEAVGAYQHVINDFSDAEAMLAAKFGLAQLDWHQHNLTDAARLFAEVAQADPYSGIGNVAAQYALQLRPKSPAASPLAPPQRTPFNLSH